MKYKGKRFEADIKKLKELAVKKKKNSTEYKSSYLVSKEELSKKYSVSIRTVENWIKNRTPWVRDKRSDAGREKKPVPAATKKMLHDAIESGLTKKDAKRVVEGKTGNKIWKKKIDQTLKEYVETDRSSAFGSEAKKFFRKLFDLDLIPPDKGIKYIYNEQSFLITKADLEDVCRILANAYNRYAEAPSKLKINRTSLRRAKLWQMFDEAITLINTAGLSLKDLTQSSAFMKGLEIDRNKLNPRINTLYKVVQHFKPDCTIDEVISLCEEYEGVYD